MSEGGTEKVMELRGAAEKLSSRCDELIGEIIAETVVEYATNPLDYAHLPHREYLKLAGQYNAETILLGMNPGPWGMAQCGIPFGATKVARELLGIIDLEVFQPQGAHPNRPVIGLEMTRQEVSGTRLWGALAQRYGTAEKILSNIFVVNHCPLLLLDQEGRNITPDKLSGQAFTDLMSACDEHLREVVAVLSAKKIIGVGKYAEARALQTFPNHMGMGLEISSIWHPSPASPLANRNDGADWRANIFAELP